MLFRRKPELKLSQPRIGPDPDQAALLERRLSALNYRPSGGFLLDKPQKRLATHSRP